MKTSRNAASTTPYNDPLFKLLLILVVAVCTINIIIFSSVIDNVPSMHLPSMHIPSMHLHNPIEEHRNANEMAVDNVEKQLDDVHTADDGDFGINDDSKDRIITLLQKVGVDVTPELIQVLPPWSSIVAQYGSKPIIHGLETCDTFRSTIPNADAFIAPAGMFNTGTNLISKLLIENCYLPERVKKLGPQSTGMRLQVPWGKHVPANWRLSHTSKVAGKVNQTAVLPVVMVKDPYHWMGSMCRHAYTAFWDHGAGKCPNLVKGGGLSNEVEVQYFPEVTKHESLVGLWNDFNSLYDEGTYPRLIVRYEDVLFYPEYVTTKVCKCAGGLLKNDEIQLMEDSAKDAQDGHVNANGLVSAIKRYGSEVKRVDGFTDEDRAYAEGALRQDLIDKYGYKIESHVGKMVKS